MKIFSLTISYFVCLLLASSLLADGRFSQLTVQLGENADFTYTTNPKTNTIVLNFKNMNVDQLSNFDQYDESLVRRVVYKDIGRMGTEVKLYLKDSNVRSVISKLDEPKRIVIDLFDRNYKQSIDPVTGLPIQGSSLPTGRAKTDEPHYLNSGESNTPLELAAPSEMSNDKSKRMLLQPTPEEQHDYKPDMDLTKVPEGRAPGWTKFPAFIYPLPTASFEGRMGAEGWQKNYSTKKMSQGQLNANKALRLFKLGHELQANELYQSVLHEEPYLFDNDPLHRWAFAEIQLGRGNRLLANQNYGEIVSKYPGSDLAKISQLRRLDIQALNLQGKGTNLQFRKLIRAMKRIPVTSSEQKALVAIREAYWNAPNPQMHMDSSTLPVAGDEVVRTLRANMDELESQRTAFVAGSLALRNYIEPSTQWMSEYGDFANDYFYKYRSNDSHPFYQSLKDGLKGYLTNKLVDNTDKSQVVQRYESLPKSLKSIRKTPDVAWNLANAYRDQSRHSDSIPFYRIAANNSPDASRVFQAQYWLVDSAEKSRIATTNKKDAGQFKTIAKKEDRKLQNLWSDLSPESKTQTISVFGDNIEMAVKAGYSGKAVSNMMLFKLKGSKGVSSQPEPSDKPEGWQDNGSSTASRVLLLDNLATRFKRLGMKKQWREALALLKEIKPEDLEADKKIKRLWSKQLLNLAEDLRRDQDFLEAGRLLLKAASGNQELENREETFYKGGLLLFRSGRRQEAIEAFRAAGDYSLAKERLNQLLQ